MRLMSENENWAQALDLAYKECEMVDGVTNADSSQPAINSSHSLRDQLNAIIL